MAPPARPAARPAPAREAVGAARRAAGRTGTAARTVQQRAAHALLTRVAGPDPSAARDAIHATPGPRWFDPASPVGRVHGDASMFAGGVRALLLQSLHPRAMAAVAGHSGYRADPWGRLQRTATFLATTTFGTVADAEQAIEVVKAVHRRIRGTTPDGEPYDASDPHLLRWVHVAEVDSFLAAHQRYGRRPLDAAGCDEYVRQAAVVGERLGATGLPLTYAELQQQLDAYRPELRATPAALEAAHFLLREPPLPAVVRPAYGLITSAGIALMPRWSRAPLRLPDVPAVDAAVLRPVGRFATGAIRWALAAAPPAQPPGPLVLTPPAAPTGTAHVTRPAADDDAAATTTTRTDAALAGG
ncbi:oxygenase MpaB family protein [Cellulomonas carbonis]|nr:oxygenase MpaB family protein [Cellulomonas carbonis]GGB98786.1 hypothetical protein GCM10010972_09500 [Cellulomonas carbonis]